MLFYSQAKIGVDILDQKSRVYSINATGSRWPAIVFYFVIDRALMNSWVIHKASITYRASIPKTSEKLTGSVHGAVVSYPFAKCTETTTVSPATLQLERRECDALRGCAPKHRSMCFANLRRSRTSDIWLVCQKPEDSLYVGNVAANNANCVISKN